jgi:hypothetical protein
MKITMFFSIFLRSGLKIAEPNAGKLLHNQKRPRPLPEVVTLVAPEVVQRAKPKLQPRERTSPLNN